MVLYEWTAKRRENAVKLLTNASTVLLATLVLGNFVAGKPFNLWAFVSGAGLYAAVVLVILLLEK